MASINWAMLDDQQNPIPLPGEEQVMNIEQGVEVTLLVPGRSTGGIGGSGELLKETGRLRLTDKRVCMFPNISILYLNGFQAHIPDDERLRKQQLI